MVVASRGAERLGPTTTPSRAAKGPSFPAIDRLASVGLLPPSVADEAPATAAVEAGADEPRDTSTLRPARPASPWEDEVGVDEEFLGTAPGFAATAAAAGEEAFSEAGVAAVAPDATADSLVAFVACPVDGRAPGGAERSGATAPPFADGNDRSGEAPDPRAADRSAAKLPAGCGGGDNPP